MADYWYAPDDPTPREQCPCCDYISLAERGMYEICSICFWEDEGIDIDNLDDGGGGPNTTTLRQARANFRKFGACDEHGKQFVIPENERSQYEYRPRNID